MSVRLRVDLEYDGTDFAGWQVQPNARTVQGELERVLSQIAGSPIRICGSGRTDAGVHALGQVFSCLWPGELDTARIRRSISKMLSPEIRAERVEEMPFDFHARFSAVAKRYAYSIAFAREPDPFWARYAWSLPYKIDLDRLAALCIEVTGEHDFAGFQCSRAEAQTTVRTLYSVEIRQGGMIGPRDAEGLWHIVFYGNGFLYKMVRNITGTLVEIARGALPEERLAELLVSPGPFRGHTAPAHGLALLEVIY